jgi:hypothetical protein
MQTTTKFVIALVAFVVGSILSVIPYFTLNHFEFLIPGVLLIMVSAPFTYYFYAKIKSKHSKLNDTEILRRAEIESRISKESGNAKK